MPLSDNSFLLQSDEVTIIEKRIIRHAANLTDAQLYFVRLAMLIERTFLKFNAVPVGTVEFVHAFMRRMNITIPPHMTYPDCLMTPFFLKRIISAGIFSDAKLYAHRYKKDVFVKPFDEVKKFTGALLSELQKGNIDISDNYPVYFSEPVKFIAEWRYYILNHQIVGAGRYDDGEDEVPTPDMSLIQQAVDLMKLNGSPAGYALDFGVLDTGETALIEANDGYALGYYKGDDANTSCSAVNYANLLTARWLELSESGC